MYNKTSDVINTLYKEVELFNEIAGSLDNVTPTSLSNQLSFIFEEFTETVDALEAGDDLEFIDGLADVFVTVSGLMQKAERVGYDVAEAIKRVNANNLSKYPSYAKVGENVVEFDKSLQPMGTVARLNERFGVVVFKDVQTGKIKKPANFVSVVLEGTYPIGFLKGGV